MISKFNIISNGHLLSEVDRKNLVGKIRKQSPKRYARRLGYHARAYSSYVDNDKFLKHDMAVIEVPVGDYICTIAFRGIIHKLIDVVKHQPNGNITLQSVIKAINKAVDETDVLVDCECADWKYRFSYWATKYGYKYGKPEFRPAKITNPDDNIGSMCKHLASILSNKQWMIKLSSIVNQMIKDNYDEIVRIYRLDPDEFFIMKSGYHINKRPLSNKADNTIDNTSADDTEELELNTDNIVGDTDGTTDEE